MKNKTVPTAIGTENVQADKQSREDCFHNPNNANVCQKLLIVPHSPGGGTGG